MNFRRSIIMGILLAFAFSVSAYANSSPLVYEKAPGFSIAPKGETCIAVTKEALTYVLSGGDGRTAKVKASYEMKNTSDKDVEQVMLFPFVTSYNEGFTNTVSITADGKPVKFRAYRLDDIYLSNVYISLNYKDNTNKKLMDIISIDNIIKMLNNVEYKVKNFDLNQKITVYTLHMPVNKNNQYNGDVSFKIDIKNQKVLYYDIYNIECNKDGTGNFKAWGSTNSSEVSEGKAVFAVLGGDNKGEFKSLSGQSITAEEETIGQFLRDYSVKDISGKYKNINKDDLYNYVVKKFDKSLSEKTSFVSVGEGSITYYTNNTYVGAFLYTVDFKPQSSMNVTVRYDEKATQDRRSTKEYSNMFLYLLRPAAGWKDFSNLTVNIVPNTGSPYIIDSSIKLVKDGNTGIYSGKFNTLPDKDLYFTTYKTDKPDIPEAPYVRQIKFMVKILPPIAIITCAAAIIIYIVARKRHSSLFR